MRRPAEEDHRERGREEGRVEGMSKRERRKGSRELNNFCKTFLPLFKESLALHVIFFAGFCRRSGGGD